MTALLKRGLAPTHASMIDWILQNPGGTLREMGDYFGYSVAWLSQVTNNDLFRAELARRRVDIEAVIVQDIPGKLRGAAALATERLVEKIAASEDPEFLLDSFDKVLHRYGYAPNSKAAAAAQAPSVLNQQNNLFFLSKEEFKDVQGVLVESHKLKDGESNPLPLPAPAPA